MEIVHAWFGEERLETCRKVTRWPLTLLFSAFSHREASRGFLERHEKMVKNVCRSRMTNNSVIISS